MNLYQLQGIYHIKGLDLLGLFEEFLRVSEQQEEGMDDILLKCSVIYHEILARISRHLYNKPITNNTIASEIKEFIDRNIYNKLSMEVLAKQACLSSSQVNRLFKKEYNQTPYDYILSQKITTAKLLLQYTNIPIKQIAYKLNFADEHYFSNFFKEKCGVSPKDYGK
jgi:AraC-like DNA-binding protein